MYDNLKQAFVIVDSQHGRTLQARAVYWQVSGFTICIMIHGLVFNK